MARGRTSNLSDGKRGATPTTDGHGAGTVEVTKNLGGGK